MDIRTLALASILVALAMSIYMIHFQRTRKTYAGFGLWTLGAFLVGLGMLLLALRGTAPDWLSIVLSNLILGGAMPLTYLGLQIFCDHRPHLPPHLSLLVGLLLLLIYFTHLQPDIVYRMAVISLYMAGYSAVSIIFCLRQRVSLPLANLAPALLSWSAFGLLHLARAAYMLVVRPAVADFIPIGTWFACSLLIAPVIQILLPVSLTSLCNLRLELEVAQANSQIQTLSGLLPICAQCKRIRDDSGYWHKVENYISIHSQAVFTHGICPQCIRDLYPDLADGLLSDSDSPPQPPAPPKSSPERP